MDTPELPIVAKLMLERSNDFGCEVLGKHVNPDGPEAAALIKELVEALTAISDAKHLNRYVGEFAFRLNDGDVSRHTLQRLASMFDAAIGRRLTYRELIA